jgi:hypothetical protein
MVTFEAWLNMAIATPTAAISTGPVQNKNENQLRYQIWFTCWCITFSNKIYSSWSRTDWQFEHD